MAQSPLVALAQSDLERFVGSIADQYRLVTLPDPAHRAALAETRVLICGSDFQVDDSLLETMPKLGLIACFAVGYEGIDLDWMKRHGIALTNGRGANDEDVADHTIGLLIGHRRGIVAGDRLIRDGQWVETFAQRYRSLSRATLGIVGLGMIGQAVARRAEAMRMAVRWWGPNPKPDAPWPRAESLLALADACDVLVVAAPATPDSRHMISREVIKALGPNGLLINIARGSLIDEDALIAALKDRRLGGAALDVFETEPSPLARWADVPNTVLTPHTAGGTDAGLEGMATIVAANLQAFFADEPLKTRVA